MNRLLAASNAIYRLLERIADGSGWLLIVLMTVTCVDVVCRKFGVEGFPYTKFQELEWHLHTAIFALWLGFNYVINAHPRVDSYTAALPFRTRAWIELAGVLVFALPYTLVVRLVRLGPRQDRVHLQRALRLGARAPVPMGASRASSGSACGCCSSRSSAWCCA